MSLDNIRRYSRYNIQLSLNAAISAADKETQMTSQRPIVDQAIKNYNTGATKYQTNVKSLVGKLDVTPVMQNCQQVVQTGSIGQMTEANKLIALPSIICEELNTVYATFEKALDDAYIKMSLPLPS